MIEAYFWMWFLFQHKCYIVATCDKDLRRRIRKVPGVPIMYISQKRYDATKSQLKHVSRLYAMFMFPGIPLSECPMPLAHRRLDYLTQIPPCSLNLLCARPRRLTSVIFHCITLSCRSEVTLCPTSVAREGQVSRTQLIKNHDFLWKYLKGTMLLWTCCKIAGVSRLNKLFCVINFRFHFVKYSLWFLFRKV